MVYALSYALDSVLKPKALMASKVTLHTRSGNMNEILLGFSIRTDKESSDQHELDSSWSGCVVANGG